MMPSTSLNTRAFSAPHSSLGTLGRIARPAPSTNHSAGTRTWLGMHPRSRRSEGSLSASRTPLRSPSYRVSATATSPETVGVSGPPGLHATTAAGTNPSGMDPGAGASAWPGGGTTATDRRFGSRFGAIQLGLETTSARGGRSGALAHADTLSSATHAISEQARRTRFNCAGTDPRIRMILGHGARQLAAPGS